MFWQFNPCSTDGLLIIRAATMLVLGKQKKKKMHEKTDFNISNELCCPATRSVFCTNIAAITSLSLYSTCVFHKTHKWKARVWCLWPSFLLLLPGIYGWAFRLPLRDCARVSLSLFVCCFTILRCCCKSPKWSNVIPGNLNKLVQLSYKILVILFILGEEMHTYVCFKWEILTGANMFHVMQI